MVNQALPKATNPQNLIEITCLEVGLLKNWHKSTTYIACSAVRLSGEASNLLQLSKAHCKSW